MSILEQIDKDFQPALKAKELSVISTLRLLLAALKNERIKKMADLNDEDAARIIKSEIKKRKEAISDYEKGAREDLVKKEQAELVILEKYLPKQLSEEEIRQKVSQILKGLEDKDNLGKVMSQVMNELKGSADGALVKKVVEEELKK